MLVRVDHIDICAGFNIAGNHFTRTLFLEGHYLRLVGVHLQNNLFEIKYYIGYVLVNAGNT